MFFCYAYAQRATNLKVIGNIKFLRFEEFNPRSLSLVYVNSHQQNIPRSYKLSFMGIIL
jgi:hypothetical protein